jgi:hypothetical protein
MRLLDSPRQSVCNISRTAERIFIKFDIGEFHENLAHLECNLLNAYRSDKYYEEKV